MPGRVTDTMLQNKSQDSLTRAREKLVKNQEQVVTGKLVNRPSDSPVAAMRAVSLKAQGDRNEQVTQNLELASAILNMTDSSLGELTEVLSRAKELAIQMSSTSNNTPDTRGAVANEIDQLMARAVQLGNTRIGDRYIFGGYQTDRPPFDLDGNYFGDSGVFEIEVDGNQRLMVNVPGMQPFLGQTELTPDAQAIRSNALRDGEPTLITGARAPAAAKTNPEATDPKTVTVGGPATPTKDLVEVSGTNVFRVFKDLSQGMKEGNIQEVQRSLDGLEGAFRQAISTRAMLGARQNVVQASQHGLESAKVNDAELMSQTVDADSYKVLSDLAKNEHALQASLETSKRLLTPSLLDFLK